ncbi:response regulator transcription factor [Leucobacter allii]|uniref:Response regulator transcription factor n=1 Tax=Leucobacter allii TaxID=2932247 RepID=A0ABY4FQ95_9MICO|nr:response regulator transcription factor [Leucobacter allii]UOQ58431.1 response regulator transcription factor [Leucobacter allii]UOR03011.1 response regulator transcription factor [Leucobacter allii]
MSDRPVRVRLLNDFDVVVAGLRSMLAPFAHRIAVVETEAGGVGGRPADLALYDTFGRPQADPRGLAELRADPGVGEIAVYSWNTDPELVAQALAQGCRGYLDKSLPAAELVARLERIAAGETVVPSGDVTRTADASPGDWPGRRAGLSEREAEAVSLIAQGYTNPEIAARLYVTGNSLKSYIRSAYRKMGVERRAQAVRWAIAHGLLPPDDA